MNAITHFHHDQLNTQDATLLVFLKVSHCTRSCEIWLAEGEGISILNEDPETHWALAALEAGLYPLLPVLFHVNGTPSVRYRSLQVCAMKAAKARLTTQSIEGRFTRQVG